jgi:hypothetical protein
LKGEQEWLLNIGCITEEEVSSLYINPNLALDITNEKDCRRTAAQAYSSHPLHLLVSVVARKANGDGLHKTARY